MSQLSGKIAVVTGGGSGIGLAIAQRFVNEGAYVFIVGRRQATLDDAIAGLGANAEAVQADVTDAVQLDRVFAAVVARKGRVDTLVVNSGISEYSLVDDITEAHFDGIFDLNVRAAAFTVQKAVPHMPPGGTIVLIGSIADAIGVYGYGTYAASKAALRSYARTWTAELVSRGIRVNTLSPGPVDTDMMAAASDEVRETLTARIPLGRMGRPDEVAAAALFLASSESSFIAGAELCIDGGMTQV
ncbi:glucose 1-dehydrogenase [Dyella sp. 333MFSha]|uniref:SDR family NAD(P)-dependent oxidoreductase n=1 Tax=Dyella sp. 333MFSha TaxID=1798240 RepID=UPI00088AFF3D|nr:glucose 1-dehydrogenase [Dyella sp. 333MFSha]SDF60949.1 NAD(P)-dependent dehydrogenase, short-chain alcohol dehydrogenase family [Dyella sp. 333MFSha]